MRWRMNWSFPVLTKELHEQSTRLRTYIIRTAFAGLFYLAALGVMAHLLFTNSRTWLPVLVFLGHGGEIFDKLVLMLFLGVYALMPALSCGVITSEKERQTMTLLYLTGLSGTSVVLEKYLSRIVPMATCLLLCLPSIAFIYSMGGLTPLHLVAGLWFPLLAVLLVGSVGVLCSSLCRTTIRSLVLTYAILFLLSAAPVVIRNTFGDSLSWMTSWAAELMNSGNAIPLATVDVHGLLDWIWFPPFLWNQLLNQPQLSWSHLYWPSLPSLLVILVCLTGSRWALWRYAFPRGISWTLWLFRRLDHWFGAANRSIAQGKQVVKEAADLPDMKPIAWFESSKQATGQFRHLLRILIVVETVVLIWLSWVSIYSTNIRQNMNAAMLLAWCVAVVLLVSRGATIVATERSRQTLEVLLATPISSREIILQKFSGLRRLMWVCAAPLLTCVIANACWRMSGSHYAFAWSRSPETVWSVAAYLFYGIVTISVYLPLIAWTAIWAGLRSISPSRGMVSAMVCLFLWCMLPIGVFGIPVMAVGSALGSQAAVMFTPVQLSPVTILIAVETMPAAEIRPSLWIWALSNALIFATCVRYISQRCLRNADRLLGRVPNY